LSKFTQYIEKNSILYERLHKQILAKRIESEPRRHLQVIYGPRQVGKTTLVNQLSEKISLPYHYATSDAVFSDQVFWLEQHWNTARAMLVDSEKKESVLIIDEIQKIQGWSEIVKKLWDEDSRNKTELKVILLGSSRLLIQKGLTESLAGRFETIFVGHWTYTEMQDAFGFTPEQYVWYGGYPGGAPLIKNEERWKQYIRESLIETSISRDILLLTRVDKPALMRKLFDLGCAFSGQILSYSKIMGQLQDAGNTTTLAHYLNLLDTAGLLAGLEKYSPAIIRQRASSPKFQVHNTALISAQKISGINAILKSNEDWGRWVESAVGAHLLNYSLTQNYKLYYWRQGDHEVDFILEYDGRIIAFEVKSGSYSKIRGMGAFGKKFKPEKTILVGEAGIPWQEFLKLNPLSLFN
jgi:predicted AAA+ superfamily ATPase